MRPSFALPAAFFLSGAAGLIFQVTWFYRCSLVLGSSLAAVTVVLSGFMAGLAAGYALSARFAGLSARPLGVYAQLEGVVAVAGLAVTWGLPHVGGLLAPLAGGALPGLTLDAARFTVAFLLLVVPATAMGATLPVLVAATMGRGPFGAALGRLYGWNTLGAVAGVILSESVLVGALGVFGSAGIAALLNVAAAMIAVRVRLPAEQGGASATVFWPTAVETSPADVAGRRANGAALLAAAALSGASMLALEVIWFRFLSMYVLVTTLAMSLMLAVVLTGIGLGGLVAALWLARRPTAASALPTLACATGLAVLVPYVTFQWLTSGTQLGHWTSVLWSAIVLTGPASLLSGLLFACTGDALHARGTAPSRSAGWLAFANTAGALAGPPTAAYVLLPRVGVEGGLVVVALAYGVVALLAYAGMRRAVAQPSGRFGRGMPLAASAVSLGVALLAVPFAALDSAYVLRAAAAYAGDGATVVAMREGASETLFVMQQRWLDQPVYSRLVTNGFSMSGTALQGQRYMRAFAYYPMLLHDGPLKKALVVCYGVGVTVGAVTHIPSIDAIHVAEISRDIVAMSDAIYEPGARPLADPRVQLHIEDGRFFLQTTSERFDLITGEPPPPRTPGTVNIYTREYFELVRDRLNEGGMATYWVPVARPNPGTDVSAIIRAFCDVFSDCSLWNATPFDLMLVGSRGLRGPRTMAQFSTPWQTPGLEARLREVGFERAEQIGATFIGDSSYLRTLTRETPPLEDNFPQRLRPVSGRPSLSDPAYGRNDAVTRLYQSALDVTRARAAFEASPLVHALWPPELIARTLPFFEHQAAINRVYWEGGQPLRQVEDLDRVLSQTTLRTLPLWLLGSDEVKQRIAESVQGDTGGAAEYARALRALSGRDYGGAAQFLAAAERRRLNSPTVRGLRAYALMKSGQAELARQFAAAATPTSDDERRFWEWLRMRL